MNISFHFIYGKYFVDEIVAVSLLNLGLQSETNVDQVAFAAEFERTLKRLLSQTSTPPAEKFQRPLFGNRATGYM